MSAVQSAFPKLREDSGRIYFYRTAAAFGAAQHSRILIDGTMVGHSRPDGVFYVDVPEGMHTIALPSQGMARDNTLPVRVTAGETVFIRTWVGGSGFAGRTNMEVVEPEEAHRLINNLKYTGAERADPTE